MYKAADSQPSAETDDRESSIYVSSFSPQPAPEIPDEPIVQSPLELTRVKLPEHILMHSPDPVNWTMPFVIGKPFTVTQNAKDGQYEQKTQDLQQNKNVDEFRAQLDSVSVERDELLEKINDYELEIFDLKKDKTFVVEERNSLLNVMERQKLELLHEEARSYDQQLKNAISAKCDAVTRVHEIENQKAAVDLKGPLMEEERAMLHDRIQTLTADLNQNISDLHNYRRVNTIEKIHLEDRLVQKTEEFKISQGQCCQYKETNNRLTQNVKDLSTKLLSTNEKTNKVLIRYHNELDESSKLAALYKSNLEANDIQQNEFNVCFTDLKRMVAEASQQYGDLETKFKATVLQHEQELEEHKKIIAEQKTEILRANEFRYKNMYSELQEKDTKDERIMNEQFDSMQREVLELTSINRQLGSALEYVKEQVKLQQNNISTYKQQISVLEGRSKNYEARIIKLKQIVGVLKDDVLKAPHGHTASKNEASHLRGKNLTLKDTVNRLLAEKKYYNEEQQSQNLLLYNVEVIKPNLERSEMEGKSRLVQRLDETVCELSAQRLRFKEEEDRFRETTLKLKHEVEFAIEAKEKEKRQADKLRAELLSVHEVLTSKTKEIGELRRELQKSSTPANVVKLTEIPASANQSATSLVIADQEQQSATVTPWQNSRNASVLEKSQQPSTEGSSSLSVEIAAIPAIGSPSCRSVSIIRTGTYGNHKCPRELKGDSSTNVDYSVSDKPQKHPKRLRASKTTMLDVTEYGIDVEYQAATSSQLDEEDDTVGVDSEEKDDEKTEADDDLKNENVEREEYEHSYEEDEDMDGNEMPKVDERNKADSKVYKNEVEVDKSIENQAQSTSGTNNQSNAYCANASTSQTAEATVMHSLQMDSLPQSQIISSSRYETNVNRSQSRKRDPNSRRSFKSSADTVSSPHGSKFGCSESRVHFKKRKRSRDGRKKRRQQRQKRRLVQAAAAAADSSAHSFQTESLQQSRIINFGGYESNARAHASKRSAATTNTIRVPPPKMKCTDAIQIDD